MQLYLCIVSNILNSLHMWIKVLSGFHTKGVTFYENVLDDLGTEIALDLCKLNNLKFIKQSSVFFPVNQIIKQDLLSKTYLTWLECTL